MRKIIIYSIIYINILSNLVAKEPLLAILDTIVSNETQIFSIKNFTLECKPYGVITLEKLYTSSQKNSICQKSIEKFYIKNPILQEFANRLLKSKQKYRIEVKNSTCIIYAKGEITFSELLLSAGLAIKQPIFKDEEFKSYYISAQRKAKIDKKGLWNENIFNDCIKEFYK